MSSGIVDTNILIELYRHNPLTKAWLTTQQGLAITSVTWLEFMEGSRGKRGQTQNLTILAQFGLELLIDVDQRWAMVQLTRYRLSHGVSFKDCLIASVSYRLQVPVYTKNVKDFLPILPSSLVIKPY